VLHVAAENGQAAVVEQLISAGAAVDAATERGRGPGRVFGSFWEWL
jgi:ankyrin repeat protein